MKQVFTKADIMAYRQRWARFNKFEKKELQGTSLAKKFTQFLSLTSLFGAFKEPTLTMKKVIADHKNWNILRKRLVHER